MSLLCARWDVPISILTTYSLWKHMSHHPCYGSMRNISQYIHSWFIPGCISHRILARSEHVWTCLERNPLKIGWNWKFNLELAGAFEISEIIHVSPLPQRQVRGDVKISMISPFSATSATPPSFWYLSSLPCVANRRSPPKWTSSHLAQSPWRVRGLYALPHLQRWGRIDP